MAFICKTHRYAIAIKGPKFFDQTVVKFPGPLACQEGDDLLPAIHEFRPVSPARVWAVSQSDFFRITRVPTILRKPNLLNSSFTRKGWERRVRLPTFFAPLCTAP